MKDYKGVQDCCVWCKRKFSEKEIVMLEERYDLLFCRPGPDPSLNCMIRWVMSHGKTTAVEAVLFNKNQESIPGYGGKVDKCSGCQKPFWHGEVMYIDLLAGVAFCAFNVEDCVDLWRDRIGNPSAVHQAEKRRFHGNT